MSKLDELIKELCPNGVEYKPIGEICDILRGRRLTTRDLIEDGEYPVFHGGIEPIGYYNQKNRDGYSTMIINVGASAGTIGFCDKDFWSSDGCFCFSHTETLNQKFLFYVLQSNEHYLKSKVRKAGIPTLDNKEVERFPIPIPPLSIQNEIIHILDTFTSLTAELTAELTARRKQYEYYRDSLLTRTQKLNIKKLNEIAEIYDGTEQNRTDEIKLLQYVFGYAIVRLGEIAKIKNGKDYKALGSGNIPVYGSGGIMTYVDKSVYNKPTVLIPRKGSLANLFYVDSEFWNVDTIFYTEINQEIVVPKYLFYLLLKEHLENLNKAGGVPSLTQEILNKVVLLVPSCEEQERIVKILDRFDSLCNDIFSGLPAEIEARQKQYEYYRDKLLTFDRIEA